jgi:WhiB family redox-sensing transcriptional regulator
MKGFGGAPVGSSETGTGGPNAAEISLATLGLTGPEAEARSWVERGLCADVAPEDRDMWYQEIPSLEDLRRRRNRLTESEERTLRAKKICSVCPVRVECLKYSIENREAHGVWGGLDERERARLGNWAARDVGSRGRSIERAPVPEIEWGSVHSRYVQQRAEEAQREVVREPKKPEVAEGGRIGGGSGTSRPEGKCLSGKHDWIEENLTCKAGGKPYCRLCNNERSLEAKARRRKTDPVAAQRVERRKWRLEEMIAEAAPLVEQGMARKDIALALQVRRETLDKAFERWNRKMREQGNG